MDVDMKQYHIKYHKIDGVPQKVIVTKWQGRTKTQKVYCKLNQRNFDLILKFLFKHAVNKKYGTNKRIEIFWAYSCNW